MSRKGTGLTVGGREIGRWEFLGLCGMASDRAGLSNLGVNHRVIRMLRHCDLNGIDPDELKGFDDLFDKPDAKPKRRRRKKR